MLYVRKQNDSKCGDCGRESAAVRINNCDLCRRCVKKRTSEVAMLGAIFSRPVSVSRALAYGALSRLSGLEAN